MGKGHDIVPKRGYCGNLPHRCSDASSTAPRERGTCAEDSLRSTENSCPNSKTAPPRQHWIQESPIISPDPESGRSPRCYSAKRSQKGGRPLVSLSHRSPDRALNNLSRPISLSDRKWFLEIGDISD